jgi:phosphoglycerate dehydrogenase-like enzyme
MNVSVIPGRELPAAREPARTRKGATRLVFALNGESEARFRAAFDPAQLPGTEVRWLNLRELPGASWEGALREINPEILVTGWNSRRIPEDYLPDGERALRYVCHLTGTVRDLVPRSLIERGLLVTNWGSSISHTVAEHAMLLVLAALRNMPLWGEYIEDWPRRRSLPTRRLRGKRVGLHGFGAIARELANMLRPFGAHVSAFSHGVPPDFFREHGVEAAPSLGGLFSSSDILIECEALTAATAGSVDEAMIRLLPAGAVFINVGRSRIVDEDALARVACERGLRLGIDVFHHEPPSPGLPLLQVPGAILSPHIAGPTADAFPVLWDFAMENVARYLAGDDLQGLVTMDVYERST